MSTKNLLITDREKIREAWGKTNEDILKDIKLLKEWLVTQKHLPEIPTDNMIEFFLTNCKFSIEKTKQNLDMYYTVKDLIPDIYRDIHPCNPTQMEAVYAAGIMVPLPKLTPLLYRVVLVAWKNDNLEKADIRKFTAHALSNYYEVRIQEDLVMGDIGIIDYTNAAFVAFAKLTPMALKNYVFVLEKVQSNRVKQLHLLKPPSFLETTINIMKSFMSDKLKERIYVHQSVESLYKHVPQDILPTDYGGKEKSFVELSELWKKKFLDYKDRFDKIEKMTVNEALRPEKLKNDEILGYYGNFKQLHVD